MLALVMGCGGSADEGDGGADASGPLTLSPEAGLADATEDAAAAWSAATGLEIVLGTGGTHVRAVDDLEDCGSTYTMRSSKSERLIRVDAIEIRTDPTGDCMPWPATLRHEIGHALQQYASPDKALTHDGHTERGLMAAKASGVQVVDQSALVLVCAGAPCTVFTPEHR
jgi:hypothetical protein